MGQRRDIPRTADYLFSAYADGSAYRWPVTVGAWADQACRVAGRNFTREEWRRFVAGAATSASALGSRLRDSQVSNGGLGGWHR